MARRHILPPNSTLIERAVDETAPAWDMLAGTVEPAIMRADKKFQPWLAQQWQIAQFARYFQSVDDLLTAALPWLFARGTAASVRRALAWLGYDQARLDEDGPWLHIDLGRIVHEWELAAVAHVVRASLPAHVRLHRIYHGHDLRTLRLDAQPLDAAQLDNDSGTTVDVAPYGAPIQASQKQPRTSATQAPSHQGVQAARQAWPTTISTYTDRLLLDAWSLDSELLVDASLGTTALVSSSSNAPPRLQAQSVPPEHGRITTGAWQAMPAHTQQRIEQAGVSGFANDDSRRWTGTWDAAPWRPTIATRTTTKEP